MISVALTLLVLSAPPEYDAQRAKLEQTRRTLRANVTKAPSAARLEARAALLRFYDDVVFPTWAGTKWDFNGMSQTPRTGVIACGYYVSTTLQHAGFKLERIRLAQQFSTEIVRTFVGDEAVVSLSKVERGAVVERLLTLGDGLYLVGFSNHVGFVRVREGKAQFCHANYVGDGGVTCEDPLTAEAFNSETYWFGDALPDARIDEWLNGKPVVTVLTTPR